MSVQIISDFDQQRDDGEMQLLHLISRFAQVCENKNPGPVKKFSGFDSALLRILWEIDETMLPRQLSVESDRHVVAHLTVSNRRLIAFHSPHLAKDEQNAPTSDPETAAQWYVEKLRTLYESCQSVSIHAAALDRAVTGSKLSCSPQLLAQAAGISMPVEQPKTSRGPDFRELQDMAKAWILVDGDPGTTNSSGPRELTDMLIELDGARLRSQSKASKFKTGRSSCSFLSVSAEAVVVICDGTAQRLLAIIPTSQRNLAINLARRNCL